LPQTCEIRYENLIRQWTMCERAFAHAIPREISLDVYGIMPCGILAGNINVIIVRSAEAKDLITRSSKIPGLNDASPSRRKRVRRKVDRLMLVRGDITERCNRREGEGCDLSEPNGGWAWSIR